MSMTDPIADMLTRIRNACGSKHRRVDMPVSKMKTEIARILKENDFIHDFTTIESEEGQKLLRGNGAGIGISPTAKGFMADRGAAQAPPGGELPALGW